MLWKVPVPSKIRVFLWRLAKQSLPTADVLRHRNMTPQRSCSICGQDDSWAHSLLHCNMARSVWALAPEEITTLICNIQEPSVGAWLAAVFEALPHDDRTRTIVTLWALWHTRRKAIHKGIFQSPSSTHHFMERFIADLHMIKPTPESVSPSISRGVDWLPPPADMVKINDTSQTYL
jgi:hypothetical protein